ncbi:MAG: bifunctional diguanylate cyclase/phosphodiesterase [Actinomycetia bacterium]|nr:bifunctional diguanylate cyclase/phosphodiesterase [Actinomycetes bacterium]MCP4963185.1 bifunctional diguanylate cyclase/phosphodiesterase [Actinomycetes bacterium]
MSMPGRLLLRLSPVQKVLALAAAMVVMTALILLSVDLSPHHDWWPAVPVFAVGFVVTEAVVFHIEIRKQAHTFSIHETMMVMALFFVDPLGLLVARALGGAIALVVFRRSVLFKVVFNTAMFGLEVAMAVRVYEWLGHGHGASLRDGLAAIAGVAAADTASVFAVFAAITIFEGRPRRRQAVDVFNAQMLVMIIAGSVGVVGAGAIRMGAWHAFFLSIVGVGSVAVFRQHALTTSRYTGLQTLHDFSRTIANDVDVDRVLRTAMTDVVDIIAASNVAMIAPNDGAFGPAGVYHLSDGLLGHHHLPSGVGQQWMNLASIEPVLLEVDDLSLGIRESLNAGGGQVIVVRLSLDGQDVLFVATKDADSVGRFDQSNTEQVGALARQLSATLRNGLFVRQLDEASRRDELTGLDNRGEFLAKIEAQPLGQSCSVLAVGLMSFDAVNETLGHAIGDAMLVEAARRVESSVGSHAISMARLNGATFAVAVPGHIDARIDVVARALTAAVSEQADASALRVDMRCRVGLAESTPLDPLDAATVVRRADLALAEAGVRKRHSWAYTPDLDAAQQRSVQLISGLRGAIDRQEFELWFQPKVEVATGDVLGVEALIRWTHPELGPVPPDEFIELAETAGLIGEITDLVLEMAVAEARRWLDRGIPIKIAVNLSVHDVVDPALPQKVQGLVSEYGLTPDLIGLELTESALAADEQRVIDTLMCLRGMGFTLFVDDFGTGYSSLSYLRMLPIDTLKIDRAFITHLADNEHDQVIVKSTIELAHSLGLSVVAEGVEDLASFERLRDLGCETAQGFFMAKPLTREELDAWYDDLPTLKALLGYDEVAPDGLVEPGGESVGSSEVASTVD